MDKKQENYISFVCTTEFHILVTLILSETTYKKHKKIIICDDNIRTHKYLESIQNSKVWNKKYFFENSTPDKNILVLNKIIKNIDVLHFFSFSNPYLNNFFINCFKKKIKVYLTDEGLGSYDPYKRWPPALKFIETKERNELLTVMKKIDEYFLINPKLYCGSNKIKISKINTESYIKLLNDSKKYQEFCNIFPFDTNNKINIDIVYFHQNFFESKKLTKEIDNYINTSIKNPIKLKKYHLKFHPASYLNNSSKLKNIIPNIPWEAIIIHQIHNNINFPSIYISAFSSAMINSISFGIQGKYIFLDRLLSKYLDDNSNTIQLIVKKIKNEKFKIYQPQNWYQLNKLLSTNSKNQIYYLTNENTFLLKQYKKLNIQSSKLNGIISSYQSENQNLTKQIEEVNKIVSSYQSENQNLTKQIEEVNKIVSNYESENQNLTKQIEEVNKVVSSYKSENQNLSQQIEEVNKNISDVQTNLNIITSSKYYKIWRFYCKFKDLTKQ